MGQSVSQFVVRNRQRPTKYQEDERVGSLSSGYRTYSGPTKFGGSSSSSSNSGSSSSSSGNQDSSTDTRFISSGNQLIDGGILGVGAGLLGGAVLGGALIGGGNNNYNSNYNNPCGRRKRQADGDDSNPRIFGLFGGGNNGCNCGRRKRRQAPGEDGVGVRFF